MRSLARTMVIGLCLSACGGPDDVSLKDLGGEMGRTTCKKLYDCCTEEEIAEELGLFGSDVDSEEDCVNFYNGLISALLVPSLEASIDRGRVAYHADNAGECLDAFDSLSCAEFGRSGAGDDLVPGVEACGVIIEPLVENGGACANDNECISGLCDGASEEEDGMCVALPGEGEDCTFDCAEGLTCVFGSDGSTCVPQFDNGTACSGDDECASDYCEGADPGTGTDGTCADRVGYCDGN